MIQMPLGFSDKDLAWRGPRPSQRLKALVERYWGRFHKRLLTLAQTSSRHADLLMSFPAGAVAIASRPTADCARQEALRLVGEGAPLTGVALALGLPAWFRKLPPEALAQPLCESAPACLHDPGIASRILTTMPHATGRQDRWLQAVMEAAQLAEGETAAWIGGQRIFRLRRPPMVPVLPIAMYRWYTLHPDLPAGRHLPRAFDTRMGLGRAALVARHWLLRVLQDVCIDATRCDNDWCREHEVGAVTFVPLLTSTAIVEEGMAMAHCVASYVGYVVNGHCRLYSLRQAGRRIATMEVRLSERNGLPHVNQLKGPHNATPATDVVAAAHRWLLGRLAQPRSLERFRSSPHCPRIFDEAVWRPYAVTLPPQADGTMRPPPCIADLLQSLQQLELLERC